MQLPYVFSELGIALRRNLSMTISVVVTMWISLSLFGLGLLLRQQVDLAQDFWGDKQEVAVFLCTEDSSSPGCVTGATTGQQRERIEDVLRSNPRVDTYTYRTSQEEYQNFRDVYASDSRLEQDIYDSVTARSFPGSYRVRVDDPERTVSLISEIQGLPGVDNVRDLSEVLDPLYTGLDWLQGAALFGAAILLAGAILQIANTIRLAAYARRREIGIMRLVGASNFYIQLPFLLEAVLAATVGALLACGSLAAFIQLVVYDQLSEHELVEWVTWDEGYLAMIVVVSTGIVLATVPTLATTRKYTRV